MLMNFVLLSFVDFLLMWQRKSHWNKNKQRKNDINNINLIEIYNLYKKKRKIVTVDYSQLCHVI
jgi:hypothetical protein